MGIRGCRREKNAATNFHDESAEVDYGAESDSGLFLGWMSVMGCLLSVLFLDATVLREPCSFSCAVICPKTDLS
jgi:hypothetical protein